MSKALAKRRILYILWSSHSRPQCDGAFPTLSGKFARRCILRTEYGIPVVTANNYLEVLEDLGIKPWRRVRPAEPLEDYLSRLDLTSDQREEARRFAPKAEVVHLLQPNGEPYTGFRSVGKDWAGMFALLPGDYLPVVAEWKHGSEKLSLTPPRGVVTAKDREAQNMMEACAIREFEEETGIVLERAHALSNTRIPVSSRQSTQCFYPFLGTVRTPIKPGPSKLDQTEHLKLVLFPLTAWMELMRRGEVHDDCAASLTFLALLRLGRLTFTSPTPRPSRLELLPDSDL